MKKNKSQELYEQVFRVFSAAIGLRSAEFLRRPPERLAELRMQLQAAIEALPRAVDSGTEPPVAADARLHWTTDPRGLRGGGAFLGCHR